MGLSFSGLIGGIGVGMADVGKSMIQRQTMLDIDAERAKVQEMRDQRLYAHQTSERVAGEKYQTGEREAEQSYKSGEHRAKERHDIDLLGKEQTFQAGQSRLERESRSAQDIRAEQRAENSRINDLYKNITGEIRLIDAKLANDPDDPLLIEERATLAEKLAEVRSLALSRVPKASKPDPGRGTGEDVPKPWERKPGGNAPDPSSQEPAAASDGFGGDKGGAKYMQEVADLKKQFSADINTLPDTELDSKYIKSGLYKRLSRENQMLLFNKTDKLRRLRG